MAPYLSSSFVKQDFAFYGKTLRGARELRRRWKRCVDYTDSRLGEALGQAYPHAPGKYRVNGVVSNMPEFQRAFQCSAGQPMVRKGVCQVW